jgi:hypothetical protein
MEGEGEGAGEHLKKTDLRKTAIWEEGEEGL